MKRLLLVTGALALLARVVAGCADDGEAESPPVEDGGPPQTIPGDSGADVIDTDADVPDAPRGVRPTCSTDGWCGGALPEAGSYDAAALPPMIPGTVFALRSVWASPDGGAWAVSTAGHVLRFDGTNWNVVTIAAQPLHTVWGSGTTDLWIGGEHGLVQHGVVSGNNVTFTTVTTGITSTISKITGRSATDVWMIPDGLNGSGSSINKVYRLNADGKGFTATTVPSPFTDSAGKLRLSVLWLEGNDVWTAGYASTCVLPSPCKFSDMLITLKWNGDDFDAGGDPRAAWTYIPLKTNYAFVIPAATAGNDGVQLLAFTDINAYDGNIFRVANDAGTFTWTEELAETYGSPTGLWATTQNDAYLVAQGGTVRHYDGKAWNLERTALTNLTPILNDLYGVDGTKASDGKTHLFIVGDDVALHKVLP